MKSLRRVLGALPLWLGLCGLQFVLAWALAQPTAAAARAALGNHAWPYPDRLIAALTELFSLHPSIAATITVAEIASGLLGGAVALLLGGGLVARLAGPLRAPEFARAAALHLPALAAITGYGLLLRLALLLLTHRLVGAHVRLELVAVALVLSFAACVGDLAAARRVVRGDRGLHPREYLRACADVARSPRLWLASGALGLARWAVAAAIVAVALHGVAEPWSVWAARGLAAVAVFLSLWRIAVAVEFTAAPRA